MFDNPFAKLMVRNCLSIILPILLFSLGSCNLDQKRQLPNIVILYADDLGWSDLKCYGNRFHDTPNLDKLADEGMRFTNAYAPAPICSASRASIMTGKSPARLHFEFVATDKRVNDKPLLPPIRTLKLPLEEVTIAEIVRDAGYHTAMFGKWHIAEHNGEYLKWSDTFGPLQQGFEVGSDQYGSHPYHVENRKKVELQEGNFPVDTLVLAAMDYIKTQKMNAEPFLLFFSSYYVHTPVIPNNAWLIEKYRKRMKGASEDKIKYAAFVETMDFYFGQIMDALKQNGFSENTLVIFSSDNGGHPQYADNAPLRGNKWNLYEGGIKEPFIVRWPNVIDKGIESSEPIIQWDILPTIADLTGVGIPENIDGVSLLPLLCKKRTMERENRKLYWHFPYYHPPISYEGTKPCSALREGDYKLIYFYENGRMELFDLKADPKEENNLAAIHPEKTLEMYESLLSVLGKAYARYPRKNINYVQ